MRTLKSMGTLKSMPALILTCTFSLAGCSPSDSQQQLAKARAEAEAARADAASARAELVRTGVDSGPAKTPTKNCLASGGIASFRDGRSKEFTALGAYKSKTYITDDENSPLISFFKIEKHMTTNGELLKADVLATEHREVVTKKDVSLFELASISFGPAQRIDARLSDGSSFHYYNFCEVEIESLGGQKEKFLNQYPPTMFVKWKGDITTSTLDGDQGEVCGMTFQSQK
jgi:hypothetical protein